MGAGRASGENRTIRGLGLLAANFPRCWPLGGGGDDRQQGSPYTPPPRGTYWPGSGIRPSRISENCPRGAPFKDSHAATALSPLGDPRPSKFRSPAEPSGERGKQMLKVALEAGLSPEVINQDDLAARSSDAGKLIERCLRIRHCRNDELRHHNVEEAVPEAQSLRIHYGERLDMG